MGAQFTPEHLDTLRQAFRGRMSEQEAEFLRRVQAFIEDAIRDGLGFVPVMQTLQQAIRGLGRCRFDLDEARAAGEVTPFDSGRLETIRSMNGGPPSQKEAEFLRDIQGLIDYSIRNDLSFKLVVSTLGHDVNGIGHYGFNLDDAASDCFTPKVTGFAGNDADSVGEPEESND